MTARWRRAFGAGGSRGGGPDDPYRAKWWIAAGVTLASAMELVDTTIVNVGMADIGASLGATIDEVAWVSIGYLLSAVIVLPLTGWLGDVLGRKRYFAGSILLFTGASLLAGLAGSLSALVVWRIVQGIGGGALIATAQAILFEHFPPDQKALASAIYGIGMMVGPAIGPTLGGVIIDRYSWPWMFFINIPIGVLSFILVWAFVPEAMDRARRGFDVVGFALLAVGIGSLQYVLERGAYYDWFDSPRITRLTALAVATLVALVWWELRVEDPIWDLRVLRHRALAVGSVLTIALRMGLYGSIFALPLFTQRVLDYDAATTGWLFLPAAIANAVGMFGIARLGNRIDRRALIALGGALMALSMLQHARFTNESGWWDLYWPVMLRGVATGLMFVPLTTAALSGLGGRDLAEGASMFNLMRQLGGSVGISILASHLTTSIAAARARLVEHVTPYDPATRQRLAVLTRRLIVSSTDSLTAHRRAIAALDHAVQRQAMVLGFESSFRLLAWILLASIPLVVLLGRGPARARPRST
ncbi:MAG TPA: DHA2 family efflux MFS transporter permease subunit [Gemmatimonadaceae bacterium]